MANKSEPFFAREILFPAPRPISRASRQTWARDSSSELKMKKCKKYKKREIVEHSAPELVNQKQYAEHEEQSVSWTYWLLILMTMSLVAKN